ncbi:MAG TPA: ABC-type transport auxiliary lipoprotein family protein [Steroidobacteraceae bacterium]|jgi:uncharacterized lipoprotein YmbA|nr:ABC-type transport auxiliary lipoprotein family protein [Steroidobacteraceae bacterium]
MNQPIPLRNLLCAGLCILAISGCRSAPTRLYSLRTVPAQVTVLYAGPAVRVDAVHLPADMDRAEITTQSAAGEITIHELDHWAASLPRMAQQTLTADLIARLPPGKVILAPLDKPDHAMGLNVVILRSGSDAKGAVFVASWQANAGNASTRSSDLVTLESDAAVTPSEVANRLSELLAQLADRIAAQLGQSAPSSSP